MSSLDPDLCRNCRRNLEESCTDFAPTQNFCVVQLPRFFFISSMRHVASSFSSFFVRETSSFRQAFPVFLLASSIAFRSASLFALSLPHLVHTVFLFVQERVEHFNQVCKDLYQLSCRFRAFPNVHEALSTAFPAGCCHVVFVVPYHSLLFHLSLFSVMALFRTAVVFFTLDRIHFCCASMKRNGHLVHGS